jgi:hypothetical protein
LFVIRLGHRSIRDTVACLLYLKLVYDADDRNVTLPPLAVVFSQHVLIESVERIRCHIYSFFQGKVNRVRQVIDREMVAHVRPIADWITVSPRRRGHELPGVLLSVDGDDHFLFSRFHCACLVDENFWDPQRAIDRHLNTHKKRYRQLVKVITPATVVHDVVRVTHSSEIAGSLLHEVQWCSGVGGAKKMRIVYVSNTRFPWCTESEVTKALRQLKHEVVTIQEDEASPEQMMSAARSSQLFLWTRTWDRLVTHDHLRELKDLGIPTVALHEDLYLGISREARMVGDPFWAVDHCFTADGDPHCQERFKEMGINHHWLPPAVDDDACYVAEVPYAHDLVFIGSWQGYHQEWPYREQTVRWLMRNYGDRFQIWGPQGNGLVRCDDLNRLCASAKIVIGDSLCLGFTHKNYWSDRVPNLLGRSGFMIHPKIEGLERYYKLDGPDMELVTYTYGSYNELAALIEYYHSRDVEREAVRRRGFERTKKNSTWTVRLQEMFDVLRQQGAIK